jgi:DNA-binding NarL/FixJ family response regulator
MGQQLKYNILLADDHAIIRNGLEFLITTLVHSITFFHASNKKEMFQELNRNSIDLLILDLNFEEGNSLIWLQEIKTNFSGVKIIIFTSFDEAVYKNRVLSLGASAFISKISPPDEIKNTVEKILEEEKTQVEVDYSNTSSVLSILSNREMEIALLLIKGYGNLEISNELNIKSTTISTYKQRIQEKLKLNSLPELIEVFKVNQGSI